MTIIVWDRGNNGPGNARNQYIAGFSSYVLVPYHCWIVWDGGPRHAWYHTGLAVGVFFPNVFSGPYIFHPGLSITGRI